MYDIHLIFTQHKDSGNCNSLELYRIIQKIAPEVIFEELSYPQFHDSYEKGTLYTLETKAIKYYLKDHKINHIPVDTYPLPTNYHEDIDRMYDKITRGNTHESHTLRNLIHNKEAKVSTYGFSFLNSDENDKFFTTFHSLKENILNTLNDEILFQIDRLNKDMIAKRETQILKNIYNYSASNSYSTALMFIGSGHRTSIIPLITEFEAQEKVKLNWVTHF